ncbi:MAG TPA: CoB--CoM heterodisulfide reductase iron-sulfur subunit A family protein, partial [Syntrophaceae bacterium]|nr:CoB--CoM heterodisulfide reductase iron-sulfur subunit A family protein [Syntrophaceae bacterium]
ISQANTVVFIQCVGSRIPERLYCSRLCCSQSIKNALKLKELNPNITIYILYRDIRAYGFIEDYYREARAKGIIFIRYDLESKPDVKVHGRLLVSVPDPVLRRPIEISADLLILAPAVVASPDNKKLSELYKVATNEDGFFLEAHMKLRPVDFATDGIFLAGLAHYPKPIEETISQAQAAAARAATILSKPAIELEAATSEVIDDVCDGCGYCIETCPFQAISLIEYMKDGQVRKIVETNESLCKGCGNCQATCPKRGIYIKHFRLDQLERIIEAALE